MADTMSVSFGSLQPEKINISPSAAVGDKKPIFFQRTHSMNHTGEPETGEPAKESEFLAQAECDADYEKTGDKNDNISPLELQQMHDLRTNVKDEGSSNIMSNHDASGDSTIMTQQKYGPIESRHELEMQHVYTQPIQMTYQIPPYQPKPIFIDGTAYFNCMTGAPPVQAQYLPPVIHTVLTPFNPAAPYNMIPAPAECYDKNYNHVYNNVTNAGRSRTTSMCSMGNVSNVSYATRTQYRSSQQLRLQNFQITNMPTQLWDANVAAKIRHTFCYAIGALKSNNGDMTIELRAELDKLEQNTLEKLFPLNEAIAMIDCLIRSCDGNKFLLQQTVCNHPAILNIVGQLHNYKNHFNNMERFIIARALLRAAWSLSYTTITDFVNCSVPGPDGYMIDELISFYQCNHNHYFLEQVSSQVKYDMEEAARKQIASIGHSLHFYRDNHDVTQDFLYRLVLLYKGAGCRLSASEKGDVLNSFLTFIELGALGGAVIHPDGRHMVFHVVDALYRSVPKYDPKNENPAYAHILEHCCGVIGDYDVTFTVQDTSAIMRALHHYSSSSQGKGSHFFAST